MRVFWTKALAAAICLGSGGSAGRHGPVVHIGSAIGAAVSNAFHMSTERRRWLVACGAAGGIAATFNAPIAGVLFAMEVILRQATLKTVTSIVLASVSASVIGRLFFGDMPAFIVPVYELINWRELFFYGLMGVAGAFIALLFSNSIYFIEDLFNRLRFHPIAKPALGGLFVGGIIFFLPQVKGVGYEAIEDCVRNNLDIQIVVALVFIKILATALTIGSGGSGGIFAPALFIGAMFGGAFGYAIPYFYKGPIAEPGAYALVGMGTIFAGATRAPLTAIVILFEMTGDYSIILPLMISVVLAGVIANHFQKDSIYTFKLTRRGVHLFAGHDLGILSSLKASDVMIRDVITVDRNDTLKTFKEIFYRSSHNAFPVLDKDQLYGIITYNDFIRHENDPDDKLVSEICTRRLVTVTEEDDLRMVLSKFMPRDVGMIVVVASVEPKKMKGILTRSTIFDAYRVALKRRRTSDDILIDSSGEEH